MATNNIPSNFMLLQNLPRFRGNLRSHEHNLTNVTPYLDVRSFLRALENHFESEGIQNDDQKLRILFAQVDKTVGDAADFINCYAGRILSFKDISEELLMCYPEFRKSEFKHAACSVNKIKLNEPNFFLSMTKLENESRALAEAYLNNEKMSELPLNTDTKIILRNGNDISQSAILQNFIMHFVLANQLDYERYIKLNGITPDISSTRFMSQAVKLAEREKIIKNEGRKNQDKEISSEVLYKIHAGSNKNESLVRNEKSCFLCGKQGHLKRDCRYAKDNKKTNDLRQVGEFCKYCKVKGHDALKCRTRITKKIPMCTKCLKIGHDEKNCRTKKCTYCKYLGHEIKDCRKKKFNTSENRDERVQMLDDIDSPDIEFEGDNEDET